jgi:adenine phosphoribosyltransferase
VTSTTSRPFNARQVRRLGVSDTVRPVRVVHDLDGIGEDVRPDAVLDTGNELWRRWLSHSAYRDHEIILGLDAGGILPTIGVAMASRSPYRLAWKLNLDLPDKVVFHEPHARRLEVFAYGDFSGRRVLIVDDEVTTGQTAANLIKALRRVGADVVGLLCLVDDVATQGRAVLEKLDVPLCALSQI